MEDRIIDPLSMAIQFIIDAIKNGNFTNDIKYYFDLAESIREEAIKRNYIKKITCDICKENIVFIDLLGQFRVKCGCKEVTGKTKDEAYLNWKK